MPIVSNPRPDPTPRPGRPRSAMAGLVVVASVVWVLSAGVARGEGPEAEVARLRRELAEKDRIIGQLRGELATRGVEATPEPSSPTPTVAGPSHIESAPPQGLAPEPAPPRPPVTFAPPISREDESRSRLFDHLAFFVGIDGSKQPQDFGINALFGARFDVDWGIPLMVDDDRGIGLQVGTSLNPSLNAVGVINRIQGTKRRLQNFTTVGLYGRSASGFSWSVGHDFLYEQYFDTFHLGQWRGKAGYSLTKSDEVGVRLMLRSYGDNGRFGKIPVRLTPIDMGTLYWHHTWNDGPSTTLWAGLTGTHGGANAALGDTPPLRTPFVFGAQVEAPLNDHAALFGQANFINPPASGTVDAVLGIVYYPVKQSRRDRSRLTRPVMPIANNPTFAVDLNRRR